MEAGETESVSLDEFDRDFPKIPTSGIVWKKLIMMTARALFLKVQEFKSSHGARHLKAEYCTVHTGTSGPASHQSHGKSLAPGQCGRPIMFSLVKIYEERKGERSDF